MNPESILRTITYYLGMVIVIFSGLGLAESYYGELDFFFGLITVVFLSVIYRQLAITLKDKF